MRQQPRDTPVSSLNPQASVFVPSAGTANPPPSSGSNINHSSSSIPAGRRNCRPDGGAGRDHVHSEGLRRRRETQAQARSGKRQERGADTKTPSSGGRSRSGKNGRGAALVGGGGGSVEAIEPASRSDGRRRQAPRWMPSYNPVQKQLEIQKPQYTAEGITPRVILGLERNSTCRMAAG